VADVCITEYTDPGCPWAYSAEPSRRRLSWLYGESVEWRLCLVGLAESGEEYLERGFTPARQAAAYAKIAREHGMPIDTRERERVAATVPACRAVIAARLHAPHAERPLLRRLRLRTFSGELLDEPRPSRAPPATRASIPPSCSAGPRATTSRPRCART
jgi:protein-disulfide isomerase-like protein with CxxC motif